MTIISTTRTYYCCVNGCTRSITVDDGNFPADVDDRWTVGTEDQDYCPDHEREAYDGDD